MQSVFDYEEAEEERAFVRAVVTGLPDLEAGRDSSLAEAKARLRLKQSMPAVRLRFAESTVTDLAKIRCGHIEQDAPDVGDRLISGIFEWIATLRDHPDIDRFVAEIDQPLLRELVHPPFRIVCRREMKTVRIVRV